MRDRKVYVDPSFLTGSIQTSPGNLVATQPPSAIFLFALGEIRARLLTNGVRLVDKPDLAMPWPAWYDLEGELPRYLPDVRSMRVTRRDGEHLEAAARGYLGLRARFDIVLRPGWCVMRSRFLFGAMAAVPDGEGTLFGFLTGAQLPAQHLVAPVLTAAGQWAAPRAVSRFSARAYLRRPPGAD